MLMRGPLAVVAVASATEGLRRKGAVVAAAVPLLQASGRRGKERGIT